MDLRLIERLIEKNITLSELMNILKRESPSTYEHCIRVGYLSYLVAKECFLSKEDCRLIAMGGLLHDIGKIAIPERIILKPSALSDSEWQKMLRHPATGFFICKNKVPQMVLNCILFHHERGDGSGYMEGIKLDEIPFEARITAVCDSYDAMTNVRAYNEPMSERDAFEWLKKEAENEKYDTAVLNSLARVRESVEHVRNGKIKIVESISSNKEIRVGHIDRQKYYNHLE